jgi:hypothetical protein
MMHRLLAAALAAAAVSIAACVPGLPGGTLGQPDTGAAGTGGSVSHSGGAPGRGGSGGTVSPGGGAPGAGGWAASPFGGATASGAGGRATCGPSGTPPLGNTLSGGIINIAVNGAEQPPYVYWVHRIGPSSPANLVKATVGTGQPGTLSPVQGTYNAVAVDASHVYWSDGPPDQASSDLLRADLDGRNRITLAAGQPLINRLAVGRDAVYFTTTAGTVMKVGLDGGTPATLASGPLAAAEIVVDAQNVYWTRFGSDQILKVGVAGSDNPSVLVPSQASWHGLAVDASFVYWVSASDGAIMRISTIDSSLPAMRLYAPGTIPSCTGVNGFAVNVAVDATGIYWVDTTGAVFAGAPDQPDRARALATGPTGVATPLGEWFGIGVDSTRVYWVGAIGVLSVTK